MDCVSQMYLKCEDLGRNIVTILLLLFVSHQIQFKSAQNYFLGVYV